MKDPKENWIHIRFNKIHNTYEYMLVGDWKTSGYSLIFFKDKTLLPEYEQNFRLYVVSEILDYVLYRHECTYTLCNSQFKKERFSYKFVWNKSVARLPK